MNHRVRSVLLIVAIAAFGLPVGMAAGATEGDASAAGLARQAIAELRATAQGDVFVTMRQSTGVAGFVRVSRQGDLLPSSSARPLLKAEAYLGQFGDIFGIRDASQLVLRSRTTDAQGATHFTFGQAYRGVPVWGAELKVHVDAAGRLTAVNGVYVPDLAISTAAGLSARQAARLAIAEVAANPPGDLARVRASSLRAASTRLVVYRTGLIRDVAGSNQLAYEVEVTNGSSIRDFVIVHANAGKVLNRWSHVVDALHRVLYEVSAATPPVWEEGDPFPGSLNQDQQNILIASEDSYWHFFNAFGRDSYDAAGAFMRSVNNDPTIACPNANWNGATTNYCNGVTADDVVAHEWGHAYTEYTNNLIYQWQSGALNESYSDVWGETVDFLNGFGTDAPSLVRDEGDCTSHSLLRNYVVFNSGLTGFCNAGASAFGPPLDATGVTGNVVLADDGVAPTSNGCEPFVNAGAVAGNIALVDRGLCPFTVKVANAQAAGAIGVLIADNVWGPPDPLAGADATIVIPSLRIALGNGNQIKAALASGPVNVTMRLGLPNAEDNYRWLMGEDATAFGAAIRDMWNPRCVNDPGRVTDAEYFCSTLDQGGVHTNSGIPNHAYALLVDGGTYNGQTIAAIGLVKAAHIWWQAQSVYLTDSSDFVDFADALEASCGDLTGVNLEGLSTTETPAGPSGEVISAADCAEVTETIAATELRTDPADQCQFAPILDPNTPPVCAGDSTTVYLEDFEDGLAGWTLTNQGSFSGWPNLDWAADSSLPGGRAGTAAFAVDPNEGNCDLGAGDISGVMRLESPDIVVPEADGATRLTFDHYIATEANFDGGNLKISIDGGAFTLVPASAFTFNDYNTAALQPTNPLAPEPGFSGTDGGVTGGSWGESQVDLSALGVTGGQTIRLRYDFGIDGCAGVDGWYVDDVTIVQCALVDPTIEVAPGGDVASNTSATLNLTVGDPDGDAADLTLSATSSNQNLVPESGITFGGSGADRTISLTVLKKSGSAVVTVTVTDTDGNTASVEINVQAGNEGKNRIDGGSGTDLLLGRGGNDRIRGFGAIDVMGGNAGNDTLTGGPGADTFVGGPGTDTATDFNAGEGDTQTGIP
jgi:Zn-dependent metalloprotease